MRDKIESYLTKKGYKANEVYYAYLFISLAFLVITVFIIIPMISTFIISFFRYDGIRELTFRGLSNYKEVINDNNVWKGLLLTFYYLLGTLPVTLALAFFIALILSEKWFNNSLRQISTGIFFSPYILPFVGAGFIWSWLLNPMMGVVNYIFNAIGLPPQYWFNDPKLAMPSIWIVANWKFLGFFLIIYIAAIMNIPETYYEAAKIDGISNKWQEIRYITFPLTLPTTFFLLIMGTIGAFNAFSIIFITTQGGPSNATRVLIYYIYEKAFSHSQFGVGSAITVLLFILLFFCTYYLWGYYISKVEER